MTTYVSARVMSETYDFCMSTARNIIREIRGQIEAGRYGADAVIDSCGVRVNSEVLQDYLHYRRQLRNEYAKHYVPPFKEVRQ